MYGYENFEAAPITTSFDGAINQLDKDLERRIKEYLAIRCGLQEIFTYPWMDEQYVNAILQDTTGILSLSTPPSPTEKMIRSSLLPNLCKAVVKNERYFTDFSLFETAQVFRDENYTAPYDEREKLPSQRKHLGAAFVGSDKDIDVDVRVIAATNKNLREEIQKGNFREDLFFRLSVFRIHLPSLRERPGDIAEYARFFAAQFADRMGRRIDTIDKGYIAALERHAWHGNVRELRNVVERSLIMAEGNALTVGCLSPEFHAASCDGSVPDSMALDALERHHILRVLEYTKGNKAEAARLLGIGIATLYRKLESFGMKP